MAWLPYRSQRVDLSLRARIPWLPRPHELLQIECSSRIATREQQLGEIEVQRRRVGVKFLVQFEDADSIVAVAFARESPFPEPDITADLVYAS